MTSQSFDGEYIARFIQRYGYGAAPQPFGGLQPPIVRQSGWGGFGGVWGTIQLVRIVIALVILGVVGAFLRLHR